MTADQDRIQLSSLPRELANLTGAPAPEYRLLYVMTLNARLPAEKIGGRWFVLRSDLRRVADLVKAETAPKVPVHRPRQRSRRAAPLASAA